MKFLFVSYDMSEGKGYSIYPPVHLCGLATGLRNAGYDVNVFDYSSSFFKIDKYIKKIKDLNPDVVGLTSYTPYISLLYKFTKDLRTALPNAIFVIGGPHATVWPEWMLNIFSHVDFVMKGECEFSIVEFAEMLSGHRQKIDVAGLVYRQNSEIRANDMKIIKDLNKLPLVDRSFLKEYYEKKHIGAYQEEAS